MRLDGKVVIIAGGRGGLGQTVTPTFANAGARVIVVMQPVSRRLERSASGPMSPTSRASRAPCAKSSIRRGGWTVS